MIPVIETERLILRAPALADFDAYAEYSASGRSRYDGGPRNRETSWKSFAADIGQWHLLGFGCWCIEEKATGRFLGMTGINHPPEYPEKEIGWTLMPDVEGRGIAFEAASTARSYARTNLGIKTLVSYIDPENTRSIRLAERLGAVLDVNAATPNNDPCLVYRHPFPQVAA